MHAVVKVFLYEGFYLIWHSGSRPCTSEMCRQMFDAVLKD
jgi:hypothetical protein